MNYRHRFHAGNFGDVMKHALLVALVRALQRKAQGFLFLDTHAGCGRYDLAAAARGDSLARQPEWPAGIGRLWDRTDGPPAVGDYLGLVRAFDRQRGNLTAGPRFYPGSPWLVRLLARPADRLICCEKHPEEGRRLRAELAGHSRTEVRLIDGYAAVRAVLPPPERRALVLLDPPYEATDEFTQLGAALAEGLRRLPRGVFAVWYPLTGRARVDAFHSVLRSLAPPAALAGELLIAGEGSDLKMKGCGLCVINPPWQFEVAARDLLVHLAPVLAQEPGGGARVEWVVPAQ